MKKIPLKLKNYLIKRGLDFTKEDRLSIYYSKKDFPFIIRVSDHVGRDSTIKQPKYINIIVSNKDEYIIIMNGTVKSLNYADVIRLLDSLFVIYTLIPDYYISVLDEQKKGIDAENAMKQELSVVKNQHAGEKARWARRLSVVKNQLEGVLNTLNKHINDN